MLSPLVPSLVLRYPAAFLGPCPLTLRACVQVLSAYLLAVVGGNESPSNSDVATILESVGIKMSSDESVLLPLRSP